MVCVSEQRLWGRNIPLIVREKIGSRSVYRRDSMCSCSTRTDCSLYSNTVCTFAPTYNSNTNKYSRDHLCHVRCGIDMGKILVSIKCGMTIVIRRLECNAASIYCHRLL